MKKPFGASVSILLALLVFYTSSTAQEAAENSPNRFEVSARLGFNISAKLKNLGGFNSMTQIGPATGGGVDRFYDDGFVRVDGSGNQGGLTWFWGYDNSSQVQFDTFEAQKLLMHGATSPADGVVKNDGDPQLGFELSYERRLGKCRGGNWGMEAAFGFTDISIRDSRSLVSNATLVTDAYSLGDILPPLAPYAGSLTGPGPLISDSPTRMTTAATGNVVITGQRTLDAQLYGWRLGPYFELPLSTKFSVQLGGGLALAVVDSKFSFTERVAVPGGPATNRTGANSASDFLVGGYAEAQFSYALTARFSVFTGAQYQYLSEFTQAAEGKEAELDLGKAIFWTLGLRVNF